jgi:tetratricopeptide (TPR) repeat protein
MALVIAPAAAGQPADPETLELMAEFVAALQVALPHSLNSDAFQSPQHREEILAALTTLAANGARLESHGAGGEAGAEFLSQSLARETRDIRTRYDGGRHDEARFLLLHVTEVCIGCHSRLPDDGVRPLGAQLMSEQAIAALPPRQRAQFEMATRQFDAALASFESLFADPNVAPADLDLTGQFDSYLEVCLRVQNDPQRAIRVLQKLRRRSDLPEILRQNANTWIQSLQELRSAPPRGEPLPQARALLERARDRERFRDDRQALVLYVAASGVLHRYVAAQDGARLDVGEAYYLMGIIEARIGRSFWASETENFLEAAIRIGPGEPYAADAYAILEEFVVAGYTGSAGEHVPAEVRQGLAELRGLIESAHGN